VILLFSGKSLVGSLTFTALMYASQTRVSQGTVKANFFTLYPNYMYQTKTTPLFLVSVPDPNQPQRGSLSVYTCWIKGLGTRLLFSILMFTVDPTMSSCLFQVKHSQNPVFLIPAHWVSALLGISCIGGGLS